MNENEEIKLSRYCFACYHKGSINIRLISNEKGKQKTQNFVQRCQNPECFRYEKVLAENWQSADGVTINEGGRDKVYRARVLYEQSRKRHTEIKNDWATILATKSSRVYSVEAKGRVISAGSDEESSSEVHDAEELGAEREAFGYG